MTHPSLDPDIIIRLRSWSNSGLLAEAADEIERLRASLKPLLDHYINSYDGNIDALAIEAQSLLSSK